MMDKQETLERALRVLPGYTNNTFGDKQDKIAISEIIELLKAQEPVEPTKKNGAYFCGAPNCRKIIAQMVPCGAPTHRVKYCSECGRMVKWE